SVTPGLSATALQPGARRPYSAVRGGGAQPVTVIVPVIAGWKLQTYSNVPASVNVNSKLSPGASEPESNEPSLAVQGWLAESSLVTITVVPAGTSVAPLKANSEIVMVLPLPAGAVDSAAAVASAGVVAASVAGELPSSSPLQAARLSSPARATAAAVRNM